MQITLVADGRYASGGAALVVHNERLADPLDTITQHLSTLTKQRNKPNDVHLDIGHTEFMGGLYTKPVIEYTKDASEGGWSDLEDVVIGIPAWNVLRCLQEGAKRVKRGPDILRGCTPVDDFCPLEFDGPDNPHDLWRDGGFSLRKSVGVQRARTIRTRPIFHDWQLKLTIELDHNIMDEHTLENLWGLAGRYCGLGEMRPVYGRFLGVVQAGTNGTLAPAAAQAVAKKVRAKAKAGR